MYYAYFQDAVKTMKAAPSYPQAVYAAFEVRPRATFDGDF